MKRGTVHNGTPPKSDLLFCLGNNANLSTPPPTIRSSTGILSNDNITTDGGSLSRGGGYLG